MDTVKVQLQTQQHVKFGFVGMAVNIVSTSGFTAIYNGISAAILRQVLNCLKEIIKLKSFKLIIT